MDEQVKARLIGATVLVVIAVALVPELLSGRKSSAVDPASATGKPGTRTVTIDLSGAVADGARLQQARVPAPPSSRETSRLPTVEAPGAAAEQGEASGQSAGDSSGTSPPGRAATVTSIEPIAPPPARTAALAGEAKPVPADVRPAASNKGGWSVQVGAFGSADTARKLVSDLRKDGLAAYVAPLNRNGKTLHRVRVGPEPTRSDADKLAVGLKSRGLPAAVVSAD